MNANGSLIASTSSFGSLDVFVRLCLSESLLISLPAIYLQSDVLNKGSFRKATEIAGLSSVDCFPVFIVNIFFFFGLPSVPDVT